jgi:hypothetical protein
MNGLQGYRNWFFAATAYNFAWGTVVGFFPNLPFSILKMSPCNYPPLMQAMGMIVGVYAIGYLLVAIDPDRFGPFVFVGLAGKVLGPLGFVWAAVNGQLPWRFGWINVTNDLIWLPAFFPFAWSVYLNERRKLDTAPSQ